MTKGPLQHCQHVVNLSWKQEIFDCDFTFSNHCSIAVYVCSVSLQYHKHWICQFVHGVASYVLLASYIISV